MDTSVDTKTCAKCGRALPAAKFLGLTSECADCTWERLCQLAEANLNNTVAHQPSYQKADPNVFRRGYRRYHKKNREKILERMRRRFAAKERHQGLLAQAEAGYLKPEAPMRKRRAHRRGAGGAHTIEDVQRLYDEQEGRCFYCGRELNGKYGLDHKTPLSRGGTDRPENLCCACKLCNWLKDEKTAEEFVKYLANLSRCP